MNSDIIIQFNEAERLYDSKKYEESLSLYKRVLNDDVEDFIRDDLISHRWAIHERSFDKSKNKESLKAL